MGKQSTIKSKQEDVSKDIKEEIKNTDVSQEVVDLRNTLDELCIQYELTDGVQQLVAKLTSESRKLNAELSANKVDRLTRRINNYGRDTYLTDKEFIKRLCMLNVPEFYLKTVKRTPQDKIGFNTFTDSDAVLDDKAIWKKVSACPLSPTSFTDAMLNYQKFDKTKVTGRDTYA